MLDKHQDLLLSLFLIWSAASAWAAPPAWLEELDVSQLRRHVETLAAVESRVAGYPGHATAEEYVLEAFRQAGLSQVQRAPFQLTAPIDLGASLTVSEMSQTVALYGLWPSHVRCNTTPPEGITSQLVYAGYGQPGAWDNQSVAGNAVLMEWDCGLNWRMAAELGARAVVFIEPDTATRNQCEQKLSLIPISMVRFLVRRADGQRLAQLCQAGPVETRIEGLMRWESKTVANLVGCVRGTDPKLAREALIVSAHYDAISVVPAQAPGAAQACAVATLLETAAELARHPPRRSVVFLATTAHFQGLAGMIDFIGRGQFNKYRSLTWPEFSLDFDQWVLFALDLSPGADILGLRTSICKNYYSSTSWDQRRQLLAPTGRAYSNLLNSSATAQKPGRLLFCDGLSEPKGRPMQSLLPESLATEDEVANLRGETAMALTTGEDVRELFDSPHDRVESVAFQNLSQQTRTIITLLDYAANVDALPPNLKPKPGDRFVHVSGEVLRQRAAGGMAAGIPVPGAVALTRHRREKTLCGVRPTRVTIADRQGRFAIPGYEYSTFPGDNTAIRAEAYLLDPRTGDIIAAPDQGKGSAITLALNAEPRALDHRVRMMLFPCQAVDLAGLSDARNFTSLQQLRLLTADSNVELQSFGAVTTFDLPIKLWFTDGEPLAALFLPPQSRFKVLSTTLIGDPLLLLANMDGTPQAEERLGLGFEPKAHPLTKPLALQTAGDMLAILQRRVAGFAKFGIRNDYLDRALAQAAQTARDAGVALQQGLAAAGRNLTRAAWAMSCAAYPGVKHTADDMVIAVMFYMVLLLPFAVFVERLLIGTYDIRQRIAWIAAFFLGVFIIFRYIHPAFDITITPALILLSFVILVLSLLVIVLVVSKFTQQFRQLRAELGEAQAAEVGRLSAGLVAFTLGIANLRKRRLRTYLTSLTLILLTFTIMGWVSIQTSQGFRKRVRDNSASYQGLLLADLAGDPLPQSVWQDLVTAYPEAVAAPRIWQYTSGIYAFPSDTYFNVVNVSEPDRVGQARALLHVRPCEAQITGIDKIVERGRWFSPGQPDACIIPSTMAARLGWNTPGDWHDQTVTIQSRPYHVVGVFDEERFSRVLDLDGHTLAPVDVVASAAQKLAVRRRVDLNAGGTALEQAAQIDRIEPNQIMLVNAEGPGGPRLPDTENLNIADHYLASVALAWPTAASAETALRTLAQRTDKVLFAGLDDKAYDYSAFVDTSISGPAALLIPLLLSMSIIFNTMLGAVYERKREISVFSSLGLAPGHIGMLFMGEACVFANLSIVLGYLIGQGAGKILAVTGLLPGLSLNFSALAAVLTSFLIGGVVLLSALYPAWVGARVAAPSTERYWRMPQVIGDAMVMELPFTIRTEELPALTLFLYDWLQAHANYCLGEFSVADLRYLREGGGLILKARMWLEPYDLGVAQELQFRMSPTLVEGYSDVRLHLDRVAGETNSWVRVNHSFISSVRKQMLVWRALPIWQKSGFTRRAQTIPELTT